MADRRKTVLGVTAPSVRPTALAAFLLASILSVPVFLVLTILEALI